MELSFRNKNLIAFTSEMQIEGKHAGVTLSTVLGCFIGLLAVMREKVTEMKESGKSFVTGKMSVVHSYCSY